jgi:hypothetical protein
LLKRVRRVGRTVVPAVHLRSCPADLVEAAASFGAVRCPTDVRPGCAGDQQRRMFVVTAKKQSYRLNPVSSPSRSPAEFRNPDSFP